MVDYFGINTPHLETGSARLLTTICVNHNHVHKEVAHSFSLLGPGARDLLDPY